MPVSVVSQINGERLVVLGWGRAILLQLAHPLVAAGVAAHSGFSRGPLSRLGRLHSTIGAMLQLTFGDKSAASRAAGSINAIHDRVNGRLDEETRAYPRGTPYSAKDPSLLRWVHATLLDSMPLAYESFVRPLTEIEKDAYCRDSREAAMTLGIPRDLVLATRVDLDAYLHFMMENECLQVTAAARRVAHDLLYPPLIDPTRPAAWLVRLMTLGLLPAQIRDQYGFRWSDRSAGAFRRLAAMLRAVRRFTPNVVARWPRAQRR